MGRITAGFYARVSSDGQARGNTVASQVAALRERSSADEAAVSPDHAYVDEGWSGTALTRPALERLRDAIAAGELDRVYVLAPDRLARRYAYQVLLVEEFRRAGVEVVFLNCAIGGSAEDDLLLQVQGMIAEYERARILERSRRGRRHAALSGAVSALCAMPTVTATSVAAPLAGWVGSTWWRRKRAWCAKSSIGSASSGSACATPVAVFETSIASPGPG